jgi:hypothetical protein
MRCPNCDTANDEGEAICANCAEPLTAYAGQVSGLVDDRTRARAQRLAVRPAVVVPMALLDLATAFLWPVATLMGMLRASPTLNAEGTNYMGHAFGALNVALNAAILVPVALALVAIAWGTWTQKSWAWPANAVLLGLLIASALLSLPAGVLWSLVRLAVLGAAAYHWFRPAARSWFGYAS